MSIYTIDVVADYVVPEGALDTDQYVNFVMNMAAKSYMLQYNVATPDEGIQAACDAYNAALPTPPVSEP